MCTPVGPSYNWRMTTTQKAEAPHFATAGLFLEALTARDFVRLASTMEPDGVMEALLPRGLRTCRGPDEIVAAFGDWFGDADEFEVADAAVGCVGRVIQLRWRLLVRKPSRGPGQLVVEQQAFARMAASGLIERLALVCSGFQEPG